MKKKEKKATHISIPAAEEKERFHIRIYILPILLIALLTAFDQLTKYMVTSSFALYESRVVIKNILSFTYIRNAGVAWGMFQGKRIVFLVLTAVVLLFCFYLYANIAEQKKYRLLRIALIVLVSGAVGNMIDRIKLGYVVDFFCLEFINFPIFNVADIFVVVSMIGIFLLIMFKYSNEEFDEILGIWKKAGHHGEHHGEKAEHDDKKNEQSDKGEGEV